MYVSSDKQTCSLSSRYSLSYNNDSALQQKLAACSRYDLIQPSHHKFIGNTTLPKIAILNQLRYMRLLERGSISKVALQFLEPHHSRSSADRSAGKKKPPWRRFCPDCPKSLAKRQFENCIQSQRSAYVCIVYVCASEGMSPLVIPSPSHETRERTRSILSLCEWASSQLSLHAAMQPKSFSSPNSSD